MSQPQKLQGQKQKGAGVLVYKIENNVLYFLLTKDVHKQSWSDFGGRIDNKETFEKAAQREAYEESATVLKFTEPSLQQCKITSIFRNYKMFFMECPISRIDMVQQFYENRYSNSSSKPLTHCMKEKCHVRWVPSKLLRMTIERAKKREEDAKLRQELERTEKPAKVPREFPLMSEADYFSGEQLYTQDVPLERLRYFFSKSLEVLFSSNEFRELVSQNSNLQY